MDFLDEIMPPSTSEAPPARVPSIAKLSYTHRDCVDFIVANPGVSQNEIAARYGYSPSWISLVINSDAFQSALAARRQELVDPTLTVTLNERFKALTARSLEVLQEKLSQPVQAVSDQLALQAAQLGAKSLGLGVPQAAAVPSAAKLDELAERLRGFVLRHPPEGVVDVESREVPMPSQGAAATGSDAR